MSRYKSDAYCEVPCEMATAKASANSSMIHQLLHSTSFGSDFFFFSYRNYVS